MRPRLLVSLALACGPAPAPGDTGEEDPAGSTGSTGPASTSTTDTTAAPTTGQPDATTGEPCLEDEHAGDLWPDGVPTLTCGAPELCPGDSTLWFELDGHGVADGDYSNPTTVETDVERARCFVTALRDRTPGQFNFMLAHDSEGLYVYGFEIVGDLAIVRSDKASCVLIGTDKDLCPVYEHLRTLRPPQAFADCVDGDARDLWLCLYDSLEPACHPGPLACP